MTLTVPRLAITLACIPVLLTFWGCSSNGARVPKIPAKSYQPTNVYSLDHVPAEMIRIAVLPSYHPEENPGLLNTFDSTVVSELSKGQLFEVVRIDREYLKKQFGVRQINSTESLPASMFTRIVQDFGAQGVLFTDVTEFHPYRPIRVGIRAKIVDLNSGELVWVFDDLFDSAQPNVSAAARRYARQVYTDLYPLDSADSMLQSPHRFSRYVLHEAFDTMPPR